MPLQRLAVKRNNMAFNPSDFGATPVSSGSSGFNPSDFGATAIDQPPVPLAQNIWDGLAGYGKQVISNLGDTFNQGGQNVVQDVKNVDKNARAASANPQKPGLAESELATFQGAGHVAGDIAGTAGGIIGSFITPLLSDDVKTKVGGAIGDIQNKVNSIPGMTPDIAKSLGDVFNAYTLKGGAKAVPKIADAASAVKTAVTDAKGALAERSAASTAAKITDVVSPKLTARESADALASRGGTKTGILRTIKANVDPAVQRISDTVKKFVPDFNPAKSLTENINVTKKAASSMATDLKKAVVESGQDRIYSFKELGTALKGVEKPTMIAADATLSRAYDLVTSKAMEIARSNGGKISSLFQARKEFDGFVEKQFPNLYSSDTLTPMRQAIKGIRNAMTDFTAEHLPEDLNLHDRLMDQSRLLEAIENMATKAASGAQKEVGTNVLGRATSALKNHPVAGAFGGVAAYEATKKLPIVGGILP